MLNEKLVVLTTVPGRLNAEAILSYLNAFDVNAMISMEAIGSVYPVTVGELGSVEILVLENDFERASSLLEDYYQEDHSAEDFIEYDEDLNQTDSEFFYPDQT